MAEIVAKLRKDAGQHCLQAMEQLDPELSKWHLAAANTAAAAADRIHDLDAALAKAHDIAERLETWARINRHEYPVTAAQMAEDAGTLRALAAPKRS